MFQKEKRCPKCGAAFDCGGLFGCWCRDVKLDRAQLDTLEKNYVDCLCPACLKRIADAPAVTARADR